MRHLRKRPGCRLLAAGAAIPLTLGLFHQLVGNGCVYPASIPTLGSQLSQAMMSWTAYLQDMGNVPSRDHTTMTKRGPACGHAVIGTNDDTEGAVPADQYATRHEGFMYFESVIANRSFCDQYILWFQPLLHDLASAGSAPAFSWISPNLCFDGHDAPCVTGGSGQAYTLPGPGAGRCRPMRHCMGGRPVARHAMSHRPRSE